MEENVDNDSEEDDENQINKKIKKDIDYTNLTEEEIKKKKKNIKKAAKAAEKRKIE